MDYNVNIEGERRHMTPDNLTPIVSLFDERFESFKKEIKEQNKEYISLLEKTYSVKLDGMCKDIEEIKNNDDIKQLEERLNERFLNRVDVLTTAVKNLEAAVTKDQTKTEKRIDDIEKRVDTLEDSEAEKAKNLIQKIKDNALAWLVPALIVALAIILGINIPGLK